LPALGLRHNADGSPLGPNTSGVYWTSTNDAEYWGTALTFSTTASDRTAAVLKQRGMSVRCVRKPTFFLPALGTRDIDGVLVNLGIAGTYSASTENTSSYGGTLVFSSDESRLGTTNAKVAGRSVRCVR